MKNKILAAVALAALTGSSASLRAQTPAQSKDRLCVSGLISPIAGLWDVHLDITDVGISNSLIVFNQGGTLNESDSVDFLDPTRPSSPRYGAWRTVDCDHYIVTIRRVVYNTSTKQFEASLLRGTALLSADRNSWTATLNQQIFDANGAVLRSDSITGSAARIQASRK